MNSTHESNCFICTEEFTDKNFTITECNHKFHSSCFVEWLSKNSSNKNCPFCKQSLKSKITQPDQQNDREVQNQIDLEIQREQVQRGQIMQEIQNIREHIENLERKQQNRQRQQNGSIWNCFSFK